MYRRMLNFKIFVYIIAQILHINFLLKCYYDEKKSVLVFLHILKVIELNAQQAKLLVLIF